MHNKLLYSRPHFAAASLIAAVVYLLVLLLLVYGVERYQTGPLLTGYFLMFGLYLLLLWGSREVPLPPLLLLAALARLCLLPSLPSLSDDFYRFLWDGHLLINGYHPFAHPPEWYAQAGSFTIPGLTPALYEGLNSKTYYTIYPPIAQLFFAVAAWAGGSSILIGVVVLRLPFLLAEAATCWLLLKLLEVYKLPKCRVLLYALNPLVVLELVGNLHLEALAIPFVLWLLLLMQRWRDDKAAEKSKLVFSALAFAGAVATKLWPLMLGPLLVNWLGWKKGSWWSLAAGCVTLLLFLPLLGPALAGGMEQSLSLYYQRFEFNASVYYLLREIGSWWYGYNPIAQLGPFLAFSATLLILWCSFRPAAKRLQLALSMLIIYSIFLLCATTVHPWYVVPLLALMPFTSYQFPLVWSALIFLTYAGYSATGYQEPMVLVVLEYTLVLVWLLIEVKVLPRPLKEFFRLNIGRSS